MSHQIPGETLEAIFETLPFEVTFIDDNDIVRYYIKGQKEVFLRTHEAIGRNVRDCHPEKSLYKVNEVIADLKSGKRGFAEFWINFKGHKVYIRYFPVKDKDSRYIGIIEVIEDVTEFKKITGEKRLIQDSWFTRLGDVPEQPRF